MIQSKQGSGRDCWRFDTFTWTKVAATQDEHFAAGMAAVKDSVVIFGGSSNADGSTELFKDETTDTPTSWSTVSYHQKLANHYRFGSVSLDDEVFVFGELKQRFLTRSSQLFRIITTTYINVFSHRWLDIQTGRAQNESHESLVSLPPSPAQWATWL